MGWPLCRHSLTPRGRPHGTRTAVPTHHQEGTHTTRPGWPRGGPGTGKTGTEGCLQLTEARTCPSCGKTLPRGCAEPGPARGTETAQGLQAGVTPVKPQSCSRRGPWRTEPGLGAASGPSEHAAASEGSPGVTGRQKAVPECPGARPLQRPRPGYVDRHLCEPLSRSPASAGPQLTAQDSPPDAAPPAVTCQPSRRSAPHLGRLGDQDLLRATRYHRSGPGSSGSGPWARVLGSPWARWWRCCL